jgi:hypothetical protein
MSVFFFRRQSTGKKYQFQPSTIRIIEFRSSVEENNSFEVDIIFYKIVNPFSPTCHLVNDILKKRYYLTLTGWI